MHRKYIKILGVIGIIGAPWMLIDFINNGLYERFVASSISGIRNVLFMTGWICSVLGLYMLQAMGTKQWQKNIMQIQLVLLFLADCWAIIEMFAPDSPSQIFYLLNFTWPIAGIFMVVTGFVILRAKKLKGWRRYIPLLTGFWFPQTILIYFIDPESFSSLIISGAYAAIVFSLMGFVVVVSSNDYRANQNYISG